MKLTWIAVPTLLVPVLAFSQAPAADSPTTARVEQEKEQSIQFLRLVNDEQNGARLEAAEVTYRNPDGVTLRLVAAVHIAEKSYYDAIAANFENDDAVLYEMIKEHGAPMPAPGAPNDHSVAKLQKFLRDKLDLTYQLDAIDYRKANFVHADLDLHTFMRLQEERGESMATILLNSMSAAMAGKGAGPAGTGDPATDLIWLIASPDPERQMKLSLARQMQDIEALAMGLDGPNGSVILSERNKKAISVLQEQMKLGHRKISIFYGAAHMPDLARRVEELSFTPVSTQWHTAWDVTIRKDRPSMLQRWFGAGKPAESSANK